MILGPRKKLISNAVIADNADLNVMKRNKSNPGGLKFSFIYSASLYSIKFVFYSVNKSYFFVKAVTTSSIFIPLEPFT